MSAIALLLILAIWFLASIVVGFAMARFIEAGKRKDDFSRWLANPRGEQ